MIKKIISSIILSILLFSGVAFAQTDELPSAGITPGSPFFFFERFFERIGTFFIFGNAAKAERYLALAEERLAEVKVLADKEDKNVQNAVKLYEEQFAESIRLAERSGDIDTTATVSEATAKHLSVLDKVIERVPKQAKERVRQAKERSINGQFSALRNLAKKDAERAVNILAKSAENRLNAVKIRAERRIGDEYNAEEVKENLKEYERYAKFGEEISTIAGKIRTEKTIIEDLIKKATSHHLDVLKDVQEKLPVQAREQFQRALNSAQRVQELRPSIPALKQQEMKHRETERQEVQKRQPGPPSTVNTHQEQNNNNEEEKKEEETSERAPQIQAPDIQQKIPKGKMHP